MTNDTDLNNDDYLEQDREIVEMIRHAREIDQITTDFINQPANEKGESVLYSSDADIEMFRTYVVGHEIYKTQLASYGAVLHQDYPGFENMAPDQYMAALTDMPVLEDLQNEREELEKPFGTFEKISEAKTNIAKDHMINTIGYGYYTGAAAYTALLPLQEQYGLVPFIIAGIAALTHHVLGLTIVGQKSLKQKQHDKTIEITNDTNSEYTRRLSRLTEIQYTILHYEEADAHIRALRDNKPEMLTNTHVAEEIILNTLKKRKQPEMA